MEFPLLNTKEALEHHAGNDLQTALMLNGTGRQFPEHLDRLKQHFVDGVGSAIDAADSGKLSVAGVSVEELTEIYNAAREADWNNPETMQNLQEIYHRITH